ncbi:uncharacterized protein LOC135805050 [Sycon ciliatum]|uniref:uncharacterized protein LOC135805050 n=1 Tax=Sycon ciliatum TaxID=27933 RepID=UPI0020ABC110|eukprot:scpid44995/ scgid9599/ Phosphatidylinositol N-acetylglucosaminyltransferase subunit H; Phosphatidylinositol-glycan biosynthesis class H protein
MASSHKALSGRSVSGESLTVSIDLLAGSCQLFTVTRNNASRNLRAAFTVAVLASVGTNGQVWWINASLLLCVTVFILDMAKVQSESLLVIPNVGLLHTAQRSLALLHSSTFVSFPELRHLILNEGISLHRVLFYLALVVQSAGTTQASPDPAVAPKLVPLFTHTAPELALLEEIFIGVQRSMD